MKYPMKEKTERPLFSYLVRGNTDFDYGLFTDFDEALRQAGRMAADGSHVLIYEPYLNRQTGEWYGRNTIRIADGRIFYDKHAEPGLHLEFYINAGEWLNAGEDWINQINQMAGGLREWEKGGGQHGGNENHPGTAFF